MQPICCIHKVQFLFSAIPGKVSIKFVRIDKSAIWSNKFFSHLLLNLFPHIERDILIYKSISMHHLSLLHQTQHLVLASIQHKNHNRVNHFLILIVTDELTHNLRICIMHTIPLNTLRVNIPKIGEVLARGGLCGRIHEFENISMCAVERKRLG